MFYLQFRACRLAHGERWRSDVWLWDEDWSVQQLKMKKLTAKLEKELEISTTNEKPTTTPTTRTTKKPKRSPAASATDDDDNEAEFSRLSNKFKRLHNIAAHLPKRRPLLPGYPAWYRALCVKRGRQPPGERWQPGAVSIGTGMQVTPKLLSLCWEGYPLHYVREHGWGFLVPFRSGAETAAEQSDDDVDAAGETEDGDGGGEKKAKVPVDELIRRCSLIECDVMPQRATAGESDDAFRQLVEQVEVSDGCNVLFSL